MLGNKRNGQPGDGFTLLEMSIVLAIISALIGGILTGKSLIENANIRAVVRESQAYISAVRLFKQKYIYLPGDMPNATSIWGIAASGTTCASTLGTGTQTCDGDGDGKIGVTTSSIEYFRSWQQLANAGLIEGSFSGIDYAGGATANWGVGGYNIPASVFTPGAYFMTYIAPSSGSTTIFDGTYGNMLQFSGLNKTHSNPSFLTPLQAKLIDAKTDDGKPATGNVGVLYKTGTNSCTIDNTQNTDYNVTLRSPLCVLNFLLIY